MFVFHVASIPCVLSGCIFCVTTWLLFCFLFRSMVFQIPSLVLENVSLLFWLLYHPLVMLLSLEFSFGVQLDCGLLLEFTLVVLFLRQIKVSSYFHFSSSQLHMVSTGMLEFCAACCCWSFSGSCHLPDCCPTSSQVSSLSVFGTFFSWLGHPLQKTDILVRT